MYMYCGFVGFNTWITKKIVMCNFQKQIQDNEKDIALTKRLFLNGLLSYEAMIHINEANQDENHFLEASIGCFRCQPAHKVGTREFNNHLFGGQWT